jgi:hypothetical protein
MHRPPSFLPLAWAGFLACLALPLSAQVQTFSAPLTTAQGATIGTVLCETNPSIDVQGSCTATATATGWCMVNALVDPGLPVGRSAQPGAGGTPPPATCAVSLGVGFTLPVVCTGQAYRFTVQVTAQSPGGGGQPPKDHEKEHDDKEHGKDRDKNHERDKDRDKDDRVGDGNSSRAGAGGSTRTAGTPSGRTEDRQSREGGGRKDDDRKEGKDREGDRKDKDRDDREDKDHGTKPQPGGGPAVVFSVTVPYACPIPL